ncbi:MAG: transglutaminase domain-containing protein, partial [Thermoplasmata archaeon]|nr:transglutaminase domain-containing protein [Thermoplasmata archaeon]
MPDGWEVHNDLDPNNPNDADPDFDNGGVSNYGEYLNGTDPWDPDDDYGNPGGGNGGSGPPTGDGVPPDTGSTDSEVTLINVFEPPLGSLKRWQSLDGLSSEYLVYLRNDSKTELMVSSGDHDYIFYGALNVSLEADIYFRIPNPSPDAVLLDYYFMDQSLRFFKDPADNYHVLSDTGGEGTLYFTFGTNGDYFSLSIPENLTTSDEPAFLLPAISSNVNASVDWFLDNADDIGVRNLKGEDRLQPIVTNLTTYFSSFSEGNGDVPDPTGGRDIYQAIAINKIGACRHRSFAFFVTANALGVPTRYIANEAHAFVEVYIPDGPFSTSNWHRIDLGGTGSTNPGEPRPPNPPGDNETVIHLDPILSELYIGLPFTITGNITTLNNTPLSYHPYTIYANSTQVGSGSSDSYGNISMDLRLMDIGLGPNTLRLESIGYNGYSSNLSVNRSFELYSSVLFHSCVPTSIGQGVPIYCAGFLTRADGIVLPDEGLSLNWDGTQKDTFTTTDQGEYNLSHHIPDAETPNEHNLGLRFQGHDYLLEGYFNQSVEVKTIRVLLNSSVEPEEQDAGDVITVKGRVTDGTGAHVSNRGRLVIVLHGIGLLNDTLSNHTDPDGKDLNVSLTVPVTLNRGNYTLYVAFVPNDGESLPSASRNLDLRVNKITTYIYLHPRSVNIGDNFLINGTLYSGSGIAVPGNIALYWDGEYLTTLTVEGNGDFSYMYNTRHFPGPVEVKALYNGSGMFSPSQGVVEYSVFSYTSLNLDPSPTEGVVYRNITITIQGSLRDDNSQNVQGMNIYLYENDNLVNQTTTDASGFTLGYHLAPDYFPGPLDLKVVFREADYYRGTSEILNYDVHARATVNISHASNPVLAGTNLTLSGTFVDDMGHPMEFPILISFLDETYNPILDNGSFTWNHTVPLTQSSGEFELMVSFNGINNYEASFDQRIITIYHCTNLTVIPWNLTRGNPNRFEGNLRDELGNGIPGHQMDIYLRGEYLGYTTTDLSGHFLVHISLADNLTLGQAEVRVRFNGTDFYTASNRTYTTGIFATTTLELFELSYALRDALYLEGRLLNDLGAPLEGLNLSLHFNSEHLNTTTVENGAFCIQYTNPIRLGYHLLTADFQGHEYYLPSEKFIGIKVVSYLNITIGDMN